jgi:MSHA biogenesis protein MshK
MRYAHWLSAWMVAALVPAAAGAQLLSDPTRPPGAFTGAEGDAGVASGAPVLQSVMISPAVKAAIISGVVVRLGGNYGTARLVKISDQEVVLREGDEVRVLRLYPGVKKSRAAAAPATKGARSGARRTGNGDSAPGATEQ